MSLHSPGSLTSPQCCIDLGMSVFLPGVSLDLSCFYDTMVVVAVQIVSALLLVCRARVDSVWSYFLQLH